MRKSYWLGTVALAALLIGCGAGGSTTGKHPPPAAPTTLHVTLDGLARPETAGILMAQELGYFEDAGLEVIPFRPATPSRPVEYVVDGTDDIGISHQPQVVLAAAKGMPVVALGSLIPQPTMAMIWLKRSKIRGIADLRGKTIAIPGLPFQESFLRAYLERGGLTLRDVTVKRVWYNAVSVLSEGRADAVFGGDWSAEGVQLRARGLHPVITPAQTLGFPSFDELVVIARPDRVAEDPRPFRAFMSAMARGTAAAIEDPRATIEVLEKNVNANPEIDRGELEAEVRTALPLVSESGYMDPRQAQTLIDWMRGEGMIRQRLSASKLFDNSLLQQSP